MLYFVKFISSSYWLFMALDRGMESSFDFSVTTNSFCAIALIVIILTSLAYSCNQCADNTQKIGVLIHKIEIDVNDDKLNDLVGLMWLIILTVAINFHSTRFESSHFKSFRTR